MSLRGLHPATINSITEMIEIDLAHCGDGSQRGAARYLWDFHLVFPRCRLVSQKIVDDVIARDEQQRYEVYSSQIPCSGEDLFDGRWPG